MAWRLALLLVLAGALGGCADQDPSPRTWDPQAIVDEARVRLGDERGALMWLIASGPVGGPVEVDSVTFSRPGRLVLSHVDVRTGTVQEQAVDGIVSFGCPASTKDWRLAPVDLAALALRHEVLATAASVYPDARIQLQYYAFQPACRSSDDLPGSAAISVHAVDDVISGSASGTLPDFDGAAVFALPHPDFATEVVHDDADCGFADTACDLAFTTRIPGWLNLSLQAPAFQVAVPTVGDYDVVLRGPDGSTHAPGPDSARAFAIPDAAVGTWTLHAQGDLPGEVTGRFAIDGGVRMSYAQAVAWASDH